MIQPINGNNNHKIFNKLWLPSFNLRHKIDNSGMKIARPQIVEMIFNFRIPATKPIINQIMMLHKTVHQNPETEVLPEKLK